MCPGIGLRIALLSLEQHIGDDPVPVQVHRVVIVHQVVPDHLALHVPGHGVVRSHIGGLFVNGNDVLRNGAVEKHQRQPRLLRHIHNGLGGLIAAGLHNIHRQSGDPLGNGRLDLLDLGSLAALGVVILIADPRLGQRLVQGLPDAGQIGILKIVPKDGDLPAGAAGAAGGHRQRHDQGQRQRDPFFHGCSS